MGDSKGDAELQMGDQFALPAAGDSLFEPQDDWWHNACLNYSHEQWTLYAIGYKEAADLLVQRVEQTRFDQDVLVYPVLFLYRYFLELSMKNIILQGQRLARNERIVPKHHNIGELWKHCDAILLKVLEGELDEERRNVGCLVAEFTAVDAQSTSFRYPENLKGSPSLPGVSLINLRHVRDVIGKVGNLLNCANEGLHQHESFRREMDAEFGVEY